MSPRDSMVFDAWLKTRPPIVQAAASIWPVDSEVRLEDGSRYRVFGYAENEQTEKTGWPQDITLILTPWALDPAVDYTAAKQACVHVCAKHVRGASSPFTAALENH